MKKHGKAYFHPDGEKLWLGQIELAFTSFENRKVPKMQNI